MNKIWNRRKIYAAYLMWRLGRRVILPSYFINRKKIIESNEPLLDISSNPAFSIDERATKRGGLWVRASLVPMLESAAAALPTGYKLHFFGGWRSLADQWVYWLENCELQRQRHPNITDENEIKRLARMTVASPKDGYGPHQTGGAVDLTIVNPDGGQFDMGTPFPYHAGPECMTKFPGISAAAKASRKMLFDAMIGAGFQNYPGEWWHYSYGDRAHAAYRRKPHAIYGKTTCMDYRITQKEKELMKTHGICIAPGE